MTRRLILAALLACGLAAVLVAQGPLTPLMQLRGRTDGAGALYVSAGVASGAPGPLTALANLRGRTDASGNLLMTVAGGTITPTAVSVAQGTLTADAQAISTTATWNNAGVTFTHWKAVITDTASGAGSMALQLFGGAAGTTNLFSVDKSGNGVFAGAMGFTIANASTRVATPILRGTGTGVSVANVGANSCGTTTATIAGNEISGVITVGTVAGTQCRVTFTNAAPVARDCTVTDSTTTIATRATAVTTTTHDFLGAFVAGDLVTYVCMVR